MKTITRGDITTTGDVLKRTEDVASLILSLRDTRETITGVSYDDINQENISVDTEEYFSGCGTEYGTITFPTAYLNMSDNEVVAAWDIARLSYGNGRQVLSCQAKSSIS